MGLYKPDSPEPRNYGEETRDTLQAQIDLAPDLFAAEANPEFGRQAYADLDMQILRDTLMGKDGEPGLLDLYRDNIMPELAAADQAGLDVQREGDIAAVERLGERATDAFRNANPQQAALLDELNEQAMGELQSGASLPPGLAREVEQGIRGAQAARGFGYGIGDISQEALFKGQAGEALQRRRQQFAQQVAGMNSAVTTDPFLAILGRPGVQINQAAGIAGQGGAMNPGSVFNPESAYGGSLYANNFNAANNAAIASSNAKAGILGGGLSALGSIGGGWFAGRNNGG